MPTLLSAVVPSLRTLKVAPLPVSDALLTTTLENDATSVEPDPVIVAPVIAPVASTLLTVISASFVGVIPDKFSPSTLNF